MTWAHGRAIAVALRVQEWSLSPQLRKHAGLALQELAVPFTTQTRLTFEVVLPLWGHRGPHPTPTVDVHQDRYSAKERQRS
jgi:hypothetical protein